MDLDSREAYVTGENVDSKWDDTSFKVKKVSSIVVAPVNKKAIYVIKGW
ncbi:hypothetical protein [Metallosphaera hakonensis]|nr:hypothetical protein [Metallosphaera hakonensis]